MFTYNNGFIYNSLSFVQPITSKQQTRIPHAQVWMAAVHVERAEGHLGDATLCRIAEQK